MSWLPPPHDTTAELTRRPWRPPGLEGARTDRLSYIVVDEIVGNAVGLAVSGWPELDEQGRLRFAGPPRTLGADRDALQRFLSAHRRPSELADRPLRVGDVFAAATIASALAAGGGEEIGPRRLEPLLDPERWIRAPVHDVTADAREVAKVAFYAAVAPTLDEREAARLSEPDETTRVPIRAPPPPRHWLRSNLKWIVAPVVLAAGGFVAGLGAGGAFDGNAPDGAPITQTVFTATTVIEGATATLTQVVTRSQVITESTAVTESTTATATETTTATETVTITETAPAVTVTETIVEQPIG